MASINQKIEDNRRIFIKDSEGTCWQLFNLSQNKRDGSIYFTSLEFGEIDWLSLKEKDGKLVPDKISQSKNGHLSLHGLGRAHVKSEDKSTELIIDGSELLDSKKLNASLRHLFTMFPKIVMKESVSKAGSRKSDFIINSNQPLKPFTLITFAIPNSITQVDFQPSFNIDDLDEVPNGILGLVNVPLVYHNVLVFAYRTKYMDSWPQKHMIQYFDGRVVPLFFGEKNKRISSAFVTPEYKSNLTIVLNAGRA